MDARLSAEGESARVAYPLLTRDQLLNEIGS
jgi:hypothetical protein